MLPGASSRPTAEESETSDDREPDLLHHTCGEPAVCLRPSPTPPVEGPFEQVLVESEAETSANASMADLDADGDLDVVLAKGRHWPPTNRVLINDGTGHFVARDLDATPDRTYSSVLRVASAATRTLVSTKTLTRGLEGCPVNTPPSSRRGGDHAQSFGGPRPLLPLTRAHAVVCCRAYER